MPTNEIVRRRLVLLGILQGIGCRPTIYRLAVELGLSGWVINTPSEVVVEVEGRAESCAAFETRLPSSVPFPGRIDHMEARSIPVIWENGFRIQASGAGVPARTPIPPDVAVCPECLAELFDPSDRRFLYPFITCTLCGPRFTVVRSFPYDRERTSMSDFTMCPECLTEYRSPVDGRFHSQTNSCPRCGPTLWLTDAGGRPIHGDPIPEAIRRLKSGNIVAVKGIGGFHLACDALNPEAVRLLRDRKGREEKPFAVMMSNTEEVRKYCAVDDVEVSVLESPVRPIVLLGTAGRRSVAANTAPFMGTLGVMLPYSPIHHLLFGHPAVHPSQRPRVLVMTSGNRSEEPIVKDNKEALDRLRDQADIFLLHDREIVLPADDSIFRVIAGRPTVFRRSRGLVPGALRLPDFTEETSGAADQDPVGRTPHSVIVAAGGDLKCALTVVKGDQVIPGPHVGDLASLLAQQYFSASVRVLTEYLDVKPDIVVVDPHPEYFSGSLAREMGIPVEEVFHHHAHAMALLGEHGISGPVPVAVFDGTGYGTDAAIWGGEFLIADFHGFTRAAHFSYYPLPGGEAAVREPMRILAGLLAEGGALPDRVLPIFGDRADAARLWLEAAVKGINSPLTSSVGRLFDAAATAAGFRRRVTFEGQAAMWFEGVADRDETGSYPFRSTEESIPLEVDSYALIRELVTDVLNGSPAGIVAARFHNTLAAIVGAVMSILRVRYGTNIVGLSGGCFQNRLLTERTAALLEKKDFKVLQHGSVPPNDGGLSVGQALCASAKAKDRAATEG
ncbi:MAG: carbamoyltransferase HypF [Pseudomonadota bacterium]